MRVDPSNARARAQTAAPKAAKPVQQAVKNNRIDVRA